MDSWRISAVAPGAASLLIALALYPRFIAWLKRRPWNRSVREDVPESHQVKTGTPAMGGVVFVLITAALALALGSRAPQMHLLVLALVGYALIGFQDDYAKATGHRSGIRARQKLALQAVLAGFLAVAALFTGGMDAVLQVPFIKKSWFAPAGLMLLDVLLLIGVANAANLNDGMDGLCAGLTLIALAALATLAAGEWREDALLFCSLLGGSVLGFLRYNAHPARVFMGDTGAQALGGAVAMVAILVKKELWLALICLPWAADTLSVMIQVPYFKLTRLISGIGRRIFPITPIHHAFEQRGWGEWKVCALFWLIGATASVVAVKFG